MRTFLPERLKREGEDMAGVGSIDSRGGKRDDRIALR